MLSITDLKDFIDLDHETVQIVHESTHLSESQAVNVAEELLKSERGVYTLHQMFRDQIAAAAEHHQLSREQELRKAYAYFSRKYPMPRMF